MYTCGFPLFCQVFMDGFHIHDHFIQSYLISEIWKIVRSYTFFSFFETNNYYIYHKYSNLECNHGYDVCFAYLISSVNLNKHLISILLSQIKFFSLIDSNVFLIKVLNLSEMIIFFYFKCKI